MCKILFVLFLSSLLSASSSFFRLSEMEELDFNWYGPAYQVIQPSFGLKRILFEQAKYYVNNNIKEEDTWETLYHQFGIEPHSIHVVSNTKKLSQLLRARLNNTEETQVYDLTITYFDSSKHTMLIALFNNQQLYYFLDPNYGLFEFNQKSELIKSITQLLNVNASLQEKNYAAQYLISYLPQNQAWVGRGNIDLEKGVCLACVAQSAAIILNNPSRLLTGAASLHLEDFDLTEYILANLSEYKNQNKIQLLKVLYTFLSYNKKHQPFLDQVSTLKKEILRHQSISKNLPYYYEKIREKNKELLEKKMMNLQDLILAEPSQLGRVMYQLLQISFKGYKKKDFLYFYFYPLTANESFIFLEQDEITEIQLIQLKEK